MRGHRLNRQLTASVKTRHYLGIGRHISLHSRTAAKPIGESRHIVTTGSQHDGLFDLARLGHLFGWAGKGRALENKMTIAPPAPLSIQLVDLGINGG